MITIPAMLLAALIAETAAALTGGLSRPWGPLVAVAVFDLLFRICSLGVSWLVMRENPAMLVAAVPIVGVGYVGALMGLFTGVKAVRELRHAGIVRQ